MNLPVTSLDSWQQLLSHTIDDPTELIRLLDLPETLVAPAREAAKGFPLRVPMPYLRRIEKGNPDDPLLKQVLPLVAETRKVTGFVADPLSEAQYNPHQGIVHKYNGRVLLIMTGACAINCRYCFRRHFPYDENRLGPEQWQTMLNYLRADSSIEEVILSGGDPLAVSDSRLQRLVNDLVTIPHLKRLRIHSRLPVVIPQRVTSELLEILGKSRLQTTLVLHVNHGNEIDETVGRALNALRDARITLLNQAVLLRGINDSVHALKHLNESLFGWGVLPYYLFVLDPVDGAAHFDIPDADAQKLVAQLQAQLPGYLVPKLAREIPDRPSKTVLPTVTS